MELNLKKGVTLFELIIGMFISTIVLGGLVSLMVSVQVNQAMMGQLSFSAGVAQATVTRILQDAQQAVGAVGDVNNQGIYLVDDLGSQTFCFHLNESNGLAERWTCYWQSGTAISTCNKLYDPVVQIARNSSGNVHRRLDLLFALRPDHRSQAAQESRY